MADIVKNYLVISFVDQNYVLNDEGKVDFSLLIPIPDDITDKGTSAYYWLSQKDDWCINHWGTPKNASSTLVTPQDDGDTVIYFETRYNSPFEWLEALRDACIAPPRFETVLDGTAVYDADENEIPDDEVLFFTKHYYDEDWNEMDEDEHLERIASGKSSNVNWESPEFDRISQQKAELAEALRG